jgi:cysteine-rich repeat protein
MSARAYLPLLLLVGLAWVLPARAQDTCSSESQCSFKKPNILLLLDYSSSMTGFVGAPAYFPPGQTVTTRWGAELDAASWILRYQQGFFANNSRIALTRFAHDPDLKTPGTTLPTDQSFPPITDGFAIDIPFNGSDGAYLECKGSGVEAAVTVLRGTPPPAASLMMLDINKIMLTWTRGALRSAHELIERTRASHASEAGEDQRDYEVVLMTDGDWTCPDKIGQSCKENPAPEAALLKQDGVPVHVIAFGDATMQPSLNEVALQGGTSKAIDATSPAGIVDAFSSVLDHIRDSVIVPECTGKLPRVLVIMDASSSMIAGNTPGATKWDKARFALSGNPAAPNPGDSGYVEPVLTRKLTVGGREVAIEDVVHMGMVAFAAADQQQLMVGFGPCMRDNFAWAMDPHTSCVAPGCSDPYAGYPIQWTFQDSSQRMPPFVRPTHSYMPACNQTPNSKSCVGQIPNTFTGEGLRFAQKVIEDYKSAPAPFRVDPQTRFVNVLITDGQTSQGSSNVQQALEAMVAAGIDTYVIGFGTGSELDQNQLQQYAAWGNTKSAIVVDPTQAGGAGLLADALAGVVTGLGLDACCVLNDCAAQPEPPDPNPVCGDGHVDGNEVCDDGANNASYGHCGARCDGPHLHCGDKRVDAPENCDDGNTIAGDGCDATCMREEQADEDAGVATSAPKVTPTTPGRPAGIVQKPASGGAKTGAADAGVDAGGARKHQSGGGCGCVVLAGGTRAPWLSTWLLFVTSACWRFWRRYRA